jgi:predicted patatin/cPLA2 family phospholipase
MHKVVRLSIYEQDDIIYWMLRASSTIPVLTRQAVELWVNLILMAESQMLPCTVERRNKQCIKLMVIRTRPQALF